MLYHSTRNKNEVLSSREAVLQGLARDGGLFVTDDLERAQIDPTSLKGSYMDTARRVFSLLLDDYSEEELESAISAAYGHTFSAPEVTPVTKLGKMHLLELYHGPTSAFKDVALSMLPQLMSKALSGTGKKIMIATATSGDTGKAALAGFKDVPGIGISVFYPEGGVSAIQELQMSTQEGRRLRREGEFRRRADGREEALLLGRPRRTRPARRFALERQFDQRGAPGPPDRLLLRRL